MFGSIVEQLEAHKDSKNQEVIDITESIERLSVQRAEASGEAAKAVQVRNNIMKIIEIT